MDKRIVKIENRKKKIIFEIRFQKEEEKNLALKISLFETKTIIILRWISPPIIKCLFVIEKIEENVKPL